MSTQPQQDTSLAHQLELVTLERDLLRQEREREAGMVRALEQALQRVEQLEQLLREVQARLEAHKPPSARRTGQSLRPRILDLVRQHPKGITRRAMETALQPGKSLKNTLNHMCRDGILTVQNAEYFLTSDAEAKMQARVR
jgi:type I site-specific restriction endonuclease